MASPTPQQPSIRRTILQRLPIPELPGYESRLVLLEYPPGVKAPLHTHPVAATGYIIDGDVLSVWEQVGADGRGNGIEGEVERYTKGESFVDWGERRHLRSENVTEVREGESGWLRMVMSYVIKVGEANVHMV
jgi:hypothetical protein